LFHVRGSFSSVAIVAAVVAVEVDVMMMLLDGVVVGAARIAVVDGVAVVVDDASERTYQVVS
jgi:hypothetical protein